jgi:hypothetical protein
VGRNCILIDQCRLGRFAHSIFQLLNRNAGNLNMSASQAGLFTAGFGRDTDGRCPLKPNRFTRQGKWKPGSSPSTVLSPVAGLPEQLLEQRERYCLVQRSGCSLPAFLSAQKLGSAYLGRSDPEPLDCLACGAVMGKGGPRQADGLRPSGAPNASTRPVALASRNSSDGCPMGHTPTLSSPDPCHRQMIRHQVPQFQLPQTWPDTPSFSRAFGQNLEVASARLGRPPASHAP